MAINQTYGAFLCSDCRGWPWREERTSGWAKLPVSRAFAGGDMSAPLNFKQELTACFGKPVAENPTQAMIEPAYRHHGLDWRYLTIEVDPAELGDAVRGARAMGFRGFNCTIPHKVAVIQHLDGLG